MGREFRKHDVTSVVRTYTNDQGEEKKVYKQVGTITSFRSDDGVFEPKILELHLLPGVSFGIFAHKDDRDKSRQGSSGSGLGSPKNTGRPKEGQEEEIDTEEIPF